MMDAKRARELTDAFSDKRILVVGDAVLDQYVDGAVERLNPEAPVPILHARTEESRGGGAGNVAKNVASLGASATLISVVGSDEAAGDMEQVAKAEGYDSTFIADSTRPTIRKVRFLVNGQQLLRVDHEEVNDIAGDVERSVIDAVTAAAGEHDGIIVSDYAKGVITETVAEAIMTAARKHDIPVAADVKPSRASLFRGATLLSPNIKEGHEVLGLNAHERGGAEPGELAASLKEKMGTDVFLTLGPDGMFVCADGDVSCHVSQDFVREVFDVSGAGDTAVVLLLLARLAGATPEEAAEIANAAGAVVVAKVGSVAATSDEIVELMADE